MPPAKKTTEEKQVDAVSQEQYNELNGKFDQLLAAFETLQAENKALRSSGTAEKTAKPSQPAVKPATVDTITLSQEGGTQIRIKIKPQYAATGLIAIKGALKQGQSPNTVHYVRVDDALATDPATGAQTAFSQKCLLYILQNPASVQWEVQKLA